jgi:ABC-type sulfate/molybdate transport systems ATPase subunit
MSVATARTPWLDARIDHRFPGFHLDLTCQLFAQRTVVFGPSGSGKSSLLRAIAGLLEPDRGHIRVHGRTVWDGPSGTRHRRHDRCLPVEKRRVGLVLQSPAIFPHLTAAANVAYPLRGMTKDARLEKAFELLRAVDAETLADRWPRELSGGQQQRVAIARTLAADPSVLLLDEPFGALDAKARQKLARSLHRWTQERNVPVLMVTHNLEEAFSGGDEVLLMRDGRILAQGTPQDVLAEERQRWLCAIGATDAL